ncbi:AraC family transcriptional regulator [Salipiger mangrovisoli]|uniref:Helix-turn-helix transcriptional regulator n=1 Tax=Salipiger mangrovisoli TaxID=2865933 RepID=A0ABR9X5D0_9RHOB|nr:helix-turn-helix transcriptional regulator [Salipiger mangrovisoli]MBE9638716.1 helix-turn-helix transcriptional regulator [Salipiger mangrovisoli]
MSPDDHTSLFERLARAESLRAPVSGIASDYPGATRIPRHSHGRHQLMHAISGTLHVLTDRGSWLVPPDSALWMPATLEHEVTTFGTVRLRSVYLDPGVTDISLDRPEVLRVSPLVQALIVEIVALETIEEPSARSALLLHLLLVEIARMERQPLALPLPRHPRLRRLCRAFLETPTAHLSLDDWACEAAMSRRGLTRHFREETGLSPGRWRQHACVLHALPKLLAGASVTTVALDLGYDSAAAFTTMFRRILGEPPRRFRAA